MRTLRCHTGAAALIVMVGAAASSCSDHARAVGTDPIIAPQPSTTSVAPTPSATVVTIPPTTPTSTSTIPPIADLPGCGAATKFVTPARWLPTAPSGYRTVRAATTVDRRDPGPSDDGRLATGPRETIQLVDADPDGSVTALITLSRNIGPAAASGYVEAAGTPRIDAVRDRPGLITTWISRGDTLGYRIAEWDERGEHWTARSELDAHRLGDRLATLDLRSDPVRDRSHRLVEIGRTPDRAVPDLATTDIVMSTVVDRRADQPDTEIRIRIQRALGHPPALTGLVHFVGTPRLTRVGGHPAIGDDREVVTSLDGGSVATVTMSASMPPQPAPGGFDALVAALGSLWPVRPDDAGLIGIDMTGLRDGLPYCRADR